LALQGDRSGRRASRDRRSGRGNGVIAGISASHLVVASRPGTSERICSPASAFLRSR
jgi:hypothetical protein